MSNIWPEPAANQLVGPIPVVLLASGDPERPPAFLLVRGSGLRQRPEVRLFYPCPMDPAPSQPLSRHGDGYLAALGYLQIGAGSLSLLMSLMLSFQSIFSHSELRGLATVFGSSNDLLDRAIATYVAFQLSIGWIAGALQFAAGICCLRGVNARLVWAASLISLANFPHGTIAAIAIMRALRRPDLARAFAPQGIT